jgi:peptidoglycan hydrolase-like protein with peptidoglycan-binding domain
VRTIQARLALNRDYAGSVTGIYDAATRAAVARFAARENLEEHTRQDDRLDPRVLERLGVRHG